MRKLLIILLSVLLLAACGNEYHEEIKESFAKDTIEVISIISDAVVDDPDLNFEQEEILNSYERTYNSGDHSNDEAHAYLLTMNLVNDYTTGMLSGELENKVDDIEVTLQGGLEAYKDKHKNE